METMYARLFQFHDAAVQAGIKPRPCRVSAKHQFKILLANETGAGEYRQTPTA